MTKKILILLGLCVMVFAAGCGDDGEVNKTEYKATDPVIQTARVKIAEIKDAYLDEVRGIVQEWSPKLQVGGLEDEEKEVRQAELKKVMRTVGRKLVDDVKVVLAAIPQETRNAHSIDYLKLVFVEPIDYSSDQRSGEQSGVSLLEKETMVYGLSPERCAQYTDEIVAYFHVGMKKDDAEIFFSALAGLLDAINFQQGLALIDQIMKADPDGSFFINTRFSRDSWKSVKSNLLMSLERYNEANAIYDSMLSEGEDKQKILKGKEENDAQETEKRIEDRERKDDADKTGEDKRLPRAEITFVGADGKEKGAITVLLFEDDAFNAVANFISLAESGYYDNKEFFAINNIFALTGSKFDCGVGEPDYSIEAKSKRGVFRGTLTCAKSSPAQIFLMKYRPRLEEQRKALVAFGFIVKGIDEIDKLMIGDRISKIEITDKRKGSVYEPEKEKKN